MRVARQAGSERFTLSIYFWARGLLASLELPPVLPILPCCLSPELLSPEWLPPLSLFVVYMEPYKSHEILMLFVSSDVKLL